MSCGDRLSHSTVINGRPGEWGRYGCAAQGMSGRETLYLFRTEQDCEVELRFSSPNEDLYVILLHECDETETCFIYDRDFTFEVMSDQPRIIVVEGYDGAEGEYSIEVDCSCS